MKRGFEPKNDHPTEVLAIPTKMMPPRERRYLHVDDLWLLRDELGGEIRRGSL